MFENKDYEKLKWSLLSMFYLLFYIYACAHSKPQISSLIYCTHITWSS